jgi:hypothetical protein
MVSDEWNKDDEQVISGVGGKTYEQVVTEELRIN